MKIKISERDIISTNPITDLELIKCGEDFINAVKDRNIVVTKLFLPGVFCLRRCVILLLCSEGRSFLNHTLTPQRTASFKEKVKYK